MKKLITILIATTLAISTLTACSSSQDTQSTSKNKLETILEKGVLTIATSPDFAPNEFIDTSKTGDDAVVGCDMSLARYIAEYLGVELKIEQMDFSTVQAAVSTGKVDLGISGFAKTEERAENMECSDFFNWGDELAAGHSLLILKDKIDEYTTAESMSGKIIAAQNGSLQMNLALEQLPSDIEIKPISTLNDGIMMLMTGKVDAISSAYESGSQFCANYPELAMSTFMFEYESDGSVILAQKGQTELIEKVNEAIAQAKADNLFPEWFAQAKELANELGIEN